MLSNFLCGYFKIYLCGRWHDVGCGFPCVLICHFVSCIYLCIAILESQWIWLCTRWHDVGCGFLTSLWRPSSNQSFRSIPIQSQRFQKETFSSYRTRLWVCSIEGSKSPFFILQNPDNGFGSERPLDRDDVRRLVRQRWWMVERWIHQKIKDY